MNIYKEIQRLIHYGLEKELIFDEDIIYVRNRILDTLHLDEFEEINIELEGLNSPQVILDNILDYAFEQGLLEENTVTYRDLFDTKIMDCFVSRPSEVVRKFNEDYKVSPKLATEEFYKMSQSSNYIRTNRVNKNMSWKTKTKFGELDITINLSKPEKEPNAIAKAKTLKSTSYPKCLLCKENEGYQGHLNHPARQNHRIIPLELCSEEWFLQYSPYVYFNEHSIIFKGRHEPMKISKATFDRLLSFVEKFPHYFIGSNADLPIVGGSILSHDHFQGGHYTFAVEKAPILKSFNICGFEDTEVGIVNWPASIIRLRDEDKNRLSELGGYILDTWKIYSDESVEIIATTGDEPHNTITPIARFKDGKYELDLVLRNNRRCQERPLGIFHPHENLHHIKVENIGLIEIMGLAVLPARLKNELELLKMCLLGKFEFSDYPELEKHHQWYQYLQGKHKNFELDYDEILKFEVGKIFEQVLIDVGVFKINETGLQAFERFIHSISVGGNHVHD